MWSLNRLFLARLIFPLLSGPERILALGLNEAHYGQEETHGRGDYRQAA